MRETFALVLVVLASSAAFGAEKLREIRWSEVVLATGTELAPEGVLRVRSTAPGGATVTLVEIDAPGITKSRYLVEGRVRYENVEGEGFLEMWSVFGAQGSYFTRTLGGSGLFHSLTGTSPWREFGLMFDASGASEPPEKLIVNVVFPGKGEVWISPLTLSELDEDESPMGAVHPSGAVGFWGGIAGAILGIAGALFGWLGGRGKAKRFVLTGLQATIAAGAAALLFGIMGLLRGAGGEVSYALLLVGTIAVLALLPVLSTLKRRYQEAELRRMQALDT